MKNIAYSVTLLALMALGACSNDFDLTTEWKDIPVVYGLLNPQVESNYVRIEKAFLDESTSALTIAQIPDSLYYDNISARLKVVTPGGDGAELPLTRVDAATEGLVRDNGIFAQSPNILYKTSEPLSKGVQYELIIDRDDVLPPITARATVLSDIRPIRPRPESILELDYGNPNATLTVTWAIQPEMKIFDVRLVYHIKEFPFNNPDDSTIITLVKDIKTFVKAPDNDRLSIVENMPAVEFYTFLRDNLPENSEIQRELLSYDILIEAGGESLLDYIDVVQANTGLTSSQIITSFTNLSEGFGLFSSRTSAKIEGLTLKALSRDSLSRGIFTRNLNFVDL